MHTTMAVYSAAMPTSSDQHVISGAMRRQVSRQAVRERELLHQRAELVACLGRHEALRELQRVEDLRALPLAQMMLKHPPINVRVVSDQHVSIKRAAYFVLNVTE